MEVDVVYGIVYGAGGQRLDVYRPEPGAGAAPEALPTVLLWHGRGPQERDVLALLASAPAALGVVCFVPDWRSDAEDGGRAHLRESASFVRRRGAEFGGDVTRTTLAGWSLGGKTAVAVALDPAGFETWRPQAVVAISAGYTAPDPLTGRAVMDVLADADELAPSIPVQLVHGTADEVVDIEQSRRLRATLRRRSWPVALHEPDTDHAGAVMSEYDPVYGRCRPSLDPDVLRAGIQTAQLIAATATAAAATAARTARASAPEPAVRLRHSQRESISAKTPQPRCSRS